MNAGPFASLIADFAQNWGTHRPALTVSLTGVELEVDPEHPLHGELEALCKGQSNSLPFFSSSRDVVWCTVAPNSESLRQAVATLGAWALPSFGGTIAGDGYICPGSAKGEFAAKILAASPDGYYRWRCPKSSIDQVLTKLQLRRTVEQARPEQTRPPRPSLYELRARFASTLLIGDRDGAEHIINQLDLFQLETAVNTQFMRIRMWHHFGEFDRIRDHPDLPRLMAQPLPSRVRLWISEACGAQLAPTAPTALLAPEGVAPQSIVPAPTEEAVSPPINSWVDWFNALKAGQKQDAESFLHEQRAEDSLDFSAERVESLCACLDEFALDDALRSRERALILPVVGDILERYVREINFPRSDLSKFYLYLLRLWGLLHRGNSVGREHSHVLLELANALLELNESSSEVCGILDDWWRAKPSPSQLYFALDAIELMERQLPDSGAATNLWIEATDVIKRGADTLSPADLDLWRRVGLRLGFGETEISQYLPTQSKEDESTDPLAVAGLRHVAIVCLREQQAKQAAQEIEERSGAKVTVVADTAAGAQTEHACTADVVLFVWLASTHAVFRAFDSFDRRKFSYVQGTGSASIVRALERWTTNNCL
jgi:hypothetical protein